MRASVLLISLFVFGCQAQASMSAGGGAGPGGRGGARPPVQANDERAGWEKLGERVVDGRMDRDVIEVGAREGRFSRIMFYADESSLELFDVNIVFGDGETFSPSVRHVFAENSRSRVIDLPGNRRVIRRIELRYGNIRGGGRAHLEAYAR